MIPKDWTDELVGGWEVVALPEETAHRCSVPSCGRKAVVEFKKGDRGGFGCRFHQHGVDSFYTDAVARYAGYGREVPVPQVTFAAYDEYGSIVMEKVASLDAAMRQLRRRGQYARLMATIPAVKWWAVESTPDDLKMIETWVQIGWTDGETRFELVHPRIVWGDSFRLVGGHLELASEHPGDEHTDWLGSFVGDEVGGVA